MAIIFPVSNKCQDSPVKNSQRSSASLMRQHKQIENTPHTVYNARKDTSPAVCQHSKNPKALKKKWESLSSLSPSREHELKRKPVLRKVQCPVTCNQTIIWQSIFSVQHMSFPRQLQVTTAPSLDNEEAALFVGTSDKTNFIHTTFCVACTLRNRHPIHLCIQVGRSCSQLYHRRAFHQH